MNSLRYFPFAAVVLLGFFVLPSLHAQNTHRAQLYGAQAQYFSAADSPSLNLGTGGLTVEAWFKATSGSADNADIFLIAKVQSGDLAYTLSFENGGYVFGRIGDVQISNQSTLYADHVYGSAQVDDGSWHHLAMTYDQSTMRLYLDGVLAADKAVGTRDASNTASLLLGKAQGPANFDGSMDEVRIWSVARTQAQIRAAMFDEFAGPVSGLQGCWKLNNALTDSSGNGNTLTFRDGGLKAHYHFDDTADSSGSGNGLTNNGGVAFNAGRFGSAADFGSANNGRFLSTTDDLGGTLYGGSSSWSVWFNPSAQPPPNGYFELFGMAAYSGNFERDYRIQYLDVAGVKKLRWERGNYGGTDTVLDLNTTLTPGTWYHLAMVYDAVSNTLSGYLNGQRVVYGPGFNNSGNSGSSRKLTIGSWVQQVFFNSGKIDEMLVFGRALSSGELSALYAQEYNGSSFAFHANDLPFFDSSQALERCADKDTLALYHLDTLLDSSGNGRALTSQGGGVFAAAKFGGGVDLGTGNTGKYLSYNNDNMGVPATAAQSFGGYFKLHSQPDTNRLYILMTKTAGNPGGSLSFNYRDQSGIKGLELVQGCNSAANRAFYPATLPLEVWHHLVLTYDGAVARLYLNGILVQTLSSALLGVTDGNNFEIGRGGGDNIYCASAAADECFVLSRALSAAEIMKGCGGIMTARFAPLIDAVCQDDNNSQTARTWEQVHEADGTQSRQVINVGSPDGGIVCDKINDGGLAYRMDRALFNLDTSMLPDTPVSLNHASFNLFITSKDDNQSDSIAVGTHASASNTALAVTDIDNLMIHGESVQSPTPLSSISANAYSSFVFDSNGLAWISPSGMTKLTVRMGKDYNEDNTHTHPPATSRNEFHFARTAAASNKPYLSVEYISGGGTIAGVVSYAGPETGPVFISAAGISTRLAAPGVYTLTGVHAGINNVTAFMDTNGSGTFDPWEPSGGYAGNPISFTTSLTGIDIILGPTADSDHDGLGDAWEQAYGLTVGVNDAVLDRDNDGLTNIQEFYLGTNPSLPDTDGDGVPDGAEYAAGMKLLSADTDGDGMPDAWEKANGLNPLVNDSSLDADGDGLTNAQEYNNGVSSTNPSSRDSNGNGTSDYYERFGVTYLRHLFDRNDRLLATMYDNGAYESWRYDGNGNLLRHRLTLTRDADNDSLPDVWELSQNLAISSASGTQGYSGDADGDGWTNAAEYFAGTSPTDASSRPAAAVNAPWFNPPASRILFPPASGGGWAHVGVRLWDAEADNASVVLQWWDATSSQWKPATLIKVDAATPATNALVTTPSGTTHDFLWNALSDLPAYSGSILLRTTSQDAAGLTTSETAPYALNTAGDFDGDGIPDVYEIANGLDPNSASGNDGTTGDADHDGINNFGEYAFGLNPNARDADSPVKVSTATNPGDGKHYLMLTHRRRINAGNLSYIVQASPDLASWSSNASDSELVGTPVPVGDGATEIVTMRIKPSLEDGAATRKFVRIRVSAQ